MVFDWLRGKKTVTPEHGNAIKSYPIGFGDITDDSLVNPKASAALAYTYVYEVNASINAIVSGLHDFNWVITDYPKGIRKDGNELARSNDVKPLHVFQDVAKEFHAKNGASLIDLIAWSWLLYGEVYVEKVQNRFGLNVGLDWLNPAGVQVEYTEQINSFRYGWSNTYVMFAPDDVAYWHNRNPKNDFVGLPKVVQVLDKININRNLDKHLTAFFRNDARPGVISSPRGDNNLSERQLADWRESQRVSHKGVGQSWRMEIPPFPVDFTVLEQPDLAKNVALSDSASRAIFKIFRVDPAILGDTTGSPYKDQREWFWRTTVIPIAREIEVFVNVQLMPFLNRNNESAVFEFDTSAFDNVTENNLLEAQVVENQLRTSVITLDFAASIQERPAHTWMIGRIWNAATNTYMSQSNYDRWNELQFAVIEAQLQKPESEPVLPTGGGAGNTNPFKTPLVKSDCEHNHNVINHLEWDQTQYENLMRDELKSWRNFEKKRRTGRSKSKHDFECNVLPIWIKFAVIDDLAKSMDDNVGQLFDFDTLVTGNYIKSVTSYQRALRENSRGVWGGHISVEQAESNIERSIDRQFREAFNAGVKRAGTTFDNLTDEQQKVMIEMIFDEQSHVPNLVAYIDENSRANGGKLASIQSRVDLWVYKFTAVEERGFIVGSSDKKLKWVYNPEKEHCSDCSKLNGKIKTGAQWEAFGIAPRSNKLECFGIYCGCNFVETDEPVSKGKLPRLKGSGK